MSKKYAYVTFMMRNDSYLPGALVLAYSLKNNQTPHDIICLVTEEVSENAKSCLSIVFDYVIEINEFKLKSQIKGQRADRDSLLTRFQVLRLGIDSDLSTGYERIIVLDADVLPIKKYDNLFEIDAPAGIIMEKKNLWTSYDEKGSLIRKADENGEWCWHSHYNTICPHGSHIPKTITDRVVYDPANMGVNAALWRIDPSMNEYKYFIHYLEQKNISELVTRKFPWPEMQLATMMWSGEWKSIDIRYCSIGGYPDLNVLYGIHFAGLKPWQINSRSICHYAKYPDFQLWYSNFAALYYSNKQLHKIPILKRISKFIQYYV